jgi:hypothetical protein
MLLDKNREDKIIDLPREREKDKEKGSDGKDDVILERKACDGYCSIRYLIEPSS